MSPARSSITPKELGLPIRDGTTILSSFSQSNILEREHATTTSTTTAAAAATRKLNTNLSCMSNNYVISYNTSPPLNMDASTHESITSLNIESQHESVTKAVERKRIQQELYGTDDHVPISNFYTLVDEHVGQSMIPRRSSLKRTLKRSSSSNINANTEEVRPTTVRFSPKKAVKKISHLNNMPERVRAERWYRGEDFYQMKLSCKNIVRLMDSETVAGTIIDEIKETKRGLEGWTKRGACERLKCQKKAYSVVFNEQDRQWKTETQDPHKLSLLYYECSKEYVNTAIDRAEEDEIDIEEYMADTRMEELRRLDLMQRLSGLVNQMNLDSMNDSDRSNVAARCA